MSLFEFHNRMRFSSRRRMGLSAQLLVCLLYALSTTGCGISHMVEVPLRVSSNADGFTGRLVDFESGEAVVQGRVTVRLAAATKAEGRAYYVFSDREGRFRINQFTRQGGPLPLVPGDRFILVFAASGYRIKQYPVTFDGGVQELGRIEMLPDRLGGEVKPVIPGSTDEKAIPDADILRRVGVPVP